MKVKRLIPAVAMLLVSAMLLGTSTFAWFTMNDTVTAETMSIKATTNANLFIAKGASVALDAITAVAVTDLNTTAAAVKPAEMTASGATVTVKDVATFAVGQEATVSTAGTADTFTTIGTVNTTTVANETGKDVANYAAVAFVSIARKQTVAETYKLTPTCTVTLPQVAGRDSNLNKALRAGLIINGAFYESNDANTASGTATFTFSDVTGLADNTAYSVALLMWFEGEDTDCFVNNAIDLSTNTVAWSFTATTTVAP